MTSSSGQSNMTNSGGISGKLGIEQIAGEMKGKRVLVRVDFNVPMENEKVTDATRIKATVPTIEFILKQEPQAVILMSHCGRPDGNRQMKYSLKPCCEILEKLIKVPVTFVEDCIGPEATLACSKAKKGSVLLLENLRFHIEEEGKGVDLTGAKKSATKEQVSEFRESLQKLGDIFVNDAFGTAHRAHSSMVGVQLSTRAAGLLMKKELDFFGKILEKPERPFLAILGGAKVADKIQLIENLLNKVNYMIIGGGMAYTFKKILNGMPIGDSLYDQKGAEKVKAIIEKAKEKNVQILLPVDFKIADSFSEHAATKFVTEKEGIPDGWQGLDCGPESMQQAKQVILKCKTIVWNGPQGRFEWKPFAAGSLAFLEAVVEATQKHNATTVVGGGDTASLVEQAQKSHLVSHVSTGGGAALELLEGKVLPGIEALSSRT